MFAAGTDTSRFTLDWFVQLMALHPNIQDKLYQEIDSNVGKTRNNYANYAEFPKTASRLFLLQVARLGAMLGHRLQIIGQRSIISNRIA